MCLALNLKNLDRLDFGGTSEATTSRLFRPLFTPLFTLFQKRCFATITSIYFSWPTYFYILSTEGQTKAAE
jgi:hypothetical protein